MVISITHDILNTHNNKYSGNQFIAKINVEFGGRKNLQKKFLADTIKLYFSKKSWDVWTNRERRCEFNNYGAGNNVVLYKKDKAGCTL